MAELTVEDDRSTQAKEWSRCSFPHCPSLGTSTIDILQGIFAGTGTCIFNSVSFFRRCLQWTICKTNCVKRREKETEGAWFDCEQFTADETHCYDNPLTWQILDETADRKSNGMGMLKAREKVQLQHSITGQPKPPGGHLEDMKENSAGINAYPLGASSIHVQNEDLKTSFKDFEVFSEKMHQLTGCAVSHNSSDIFGKHADEINHVGERGSTTFRSSETLDLGKARIFKNTQNSFSEGEEFVKGGFSKKRTENSSTVDNVELPQNRIKRWNSTQDQKSFKKYTRARRMYEEIYPSFLQNTKTFDIKISNNNTIDIYTKSPSQIKKLCHLAVKGRSDGDQMCLSRLPFLVHSQLSDLELQKQEQSLVCRNNISQDVNSRGVIHDRRKNQKGYSDSYIAPDGYPLIVDADGLPISKRTVVHNGIQPHKPGGGISEIAKEELLKLTCDNENCQNSYCEQMVRDLVKEFEKEYRIQYKYANMLTSANHLHNFIIDKVHTVLNRCRDDVSRCTGMPTALQTDCRVPPTDSTKFVNSDKSSKCCDRLGALSIRSGSGFSDKASVPTKHLPLSSQLTDVDKDIVTNILREEIELENRQWVDTNEQDTRLKERLFREILNEILEKETAIMNTVFTNKLKLCAKIPS